jgi:hypothetical protein
MISVEWFHALAHCGEITEPSHLRTCVVSAAVCPPIWTTRWDTQEPMLTLATSRPRWAIIFVAVATVIAFAFYLRRPFSANFLQDSHPIKVINWERNGVKNQLTVLNVQKEELEDANIVKMKILCRGNSKPYELEWYHRKPRNGPLVCIIPLFTGLAV